MAHKSRDQDCTLLERKRNQWDVEGSRNSSPCRAGLLWLVEVLLWSIKFNANKRIARPDAHLKGTRVGDEPMVFGHLDFWSTGKRQLCRIVDAVFLDEDTQ